jgi:hypothetical protein
MSVGAGSSTRGTSNATTSNCQKYSTHRPNRAAVSTCRKAAAVERRHQRTDWIHSRRQGRQPASKPPAASLGHRPLRCRVQEQQDGRHPATRQTAAAVAKGWWPSCLPAVAQHQVLGGGHRVRQHARPSKADITSADQMATVLP